jgi:hypothetical protein
MSVRDPSVILCCGLALAVVLSVGAARAQDERQAWISQINQAKERAAAQREKARAEFEQRKLEFQAGDEDEQRSERNSEEVLSDMTLRYGDIVSTSRGLFRFIGRGETEPSPSDFVPYPPNAGPARRGR